MTSIIERLKNKNCLIILKSLQGNRKFSDPFQEKISSQLLITKNQSSHTQEKSQKKRQEITISKSAINRNGEITFDY